MANTPAQRRANVKWEAKAKDQIRLVIDKGQKEIIKQFAEAHGYSSRGHKRENRTHDIINRSASVEAGTSLLFRYGWFNSIYNLVYF